MGNIEVQDVIEIITTIKWNGQATRREHMDSEQVKSCNGGPENIKKPITATEEMNR